jgi:cytochrome c oxidase assembly protein subunit 15
MTTLAVLTWMAEQRWGKEIITNTTSLKPWAVIGLAILAMQIFLGGWTSSNYAALACTEFPYCQGVWIPQMDFPHAFHLVRELGVNADGSQLSPAALAAIHWTHRLGALLTFIYLTILSHLLLRHRGFRPLGMVLSALVVLQAALGISNVLLRLPLVIAVGHNAGAALLLISLVVINSKIARGAELITRAKRDDS